MMNLKGYVALKPCKLGGIECLVGEPMSPRVKIDHSQYMAAVRGGRIGLEGGAEDLAAKRARAASNGAVAQEPDEAAVRQSAEAEAERVRVEQKAAAAAASEAGNKDGPGSSTSTAE